MQIRRIDLETGDIGIISQFYQSVLELPVILQPAESIVEVGSTQLVFNQSSPAGKPTYHFAINIPANKINEAAGWLEEKAELLWMEEYQSTIADFKNWHAKSVYFIDPAGNIVELIARLDLHNESNETFSSKQFLSVSEIGIVFPEHEIEQRTTDLINTYSLTFFSRQQPLPQFKVLGDDEGLFIIVTENRSWYPTTRLSGIFPMSIEFDNSGRNYCITL